MGIDTSNDVGRRHPEGRRTIAPAAFRDEAPTTAAQAAKIILDGVKAERWRILVGDDAHKLDERVRQTPEQGL